MLTLADAATALKVSERTIRREIADGRLRAVRIRSAFRITPADWATYLAGLAECQSGKSATDGRSDSAWAVAAALSGHYRQAQPVPTRGRSKIRSAARKSTLRLVAAPPRS